jgi:hypothetical protein
MKAVPLAVTTILSLAALTMIAMAQTQGSTSAYEKKSYNHADGRRAALAT